MDLFGLKLIQMRSKNY